MKKYYGSYSSMFYTTTNNTTHNQYLVLQPKEKWNRWSRSYQWNSRKAPFIVNIRIKLLFKRRGRTQNPLTKMSDYCHSNKFYNLRVMQYRWKQQWIYPNTSCPPPLNWIFTLANEYLNYLTKNPSQDYLNLSAHKV